VLPLAGSTVPIPWSMLAPVALLTVQLRLVDDPCVIVAGVALNVLIVGTSATVTVTELVLGVTLNWFVADIVYVVVTEGVTLIDPLDATVPIPWSMLTLSAPEEVHERVVEPPGAISVSLALMLTVGISPTATVTLAVLDPYAFAAVIV